VLLSDILIYAAGNGRTSKYKLKAVVQLKGLTAQKDIAAPDKFEILGHSKKLTLRAETPQQRDQWVEAITKQVYQMQVEGQTAMLGATLDGKVTNKGTKFSKMMGVS